MLHEKKAIAVINKYLMTAPEEFRKQYFPIEVDQLYNNSELCDIIMDFLVDYYVCFCLDENYEETANGAEISKTITFIVSCKEKT